MNIEIANRLVQYRKVRGLSQEGLADALGLSRQAVSKWERAEASPDTDNLIALAQLYGVSIDTLLLSGETPTAQATPAAPAPPPDVTVLVTGEPLREEPPYKDFSHEGPPYEDSLRGSLGSHYRQLSPGAKMVLKLGAFAIGFIFFIAYGILSWIFPGLAEAYAPICTAIYLLLGFVFNLWHPGWLIFLTIPIFSSFF